MVSLYLNSTLVMQLCSEGLTKDTNILDLNTGSNGPIQFKKGRTFCQLGLVSLGDGTQLIVLAGVMDEMTKPHLNFEEHARKYFPDFPLIIYLGSSHEFGDTFINAGSRLTNQSVHYTDALWIHDVHTKTWTKLAEKLSLTRDIAAAFLLPDEFC